MSKGSAAERELCSLLWDKGYATLRAPGSGSIDRPSPDVFAQYRDTRQSYAIELKAKPDGTARFREVEIAELRQWADRAGSEPLIAVRPDMRQFDDWLVANPSDLNQTDTGYSLRLADHEHCVGLDYF